ncbi:MAG: right-handed parallel beta-helix repeat-containing protein [Actinobacteria bacterium]|nr:MAG: right-handed parallel beta-helix repeat-containing protein [Actinomycetota bacterium]
MKAVAAIVAWVLATGTGFAGVAGAGEVRCGDVITVDTRLHGDVGPCSSGGLVVGGDGIRLDLNGHSVFGMADMGDGVGISVIGRSGVVVTNGTVSHFDAGVYIEGGGYNRLSHLSVQDNISSAQAHLSPDGTLSFGDGVVLNSDHNLIDHNNIVHNGPNDGIGVFANSGHNTIRGNVVTDNDVRAGPGPSFDDGIRLESGAHDNRIVGNIVEGNGRSGIAVFAYGSGNVVRTNAVRRNGFTGGGNQSGIGRGDGIRLYPGSTGTQVRNNDVFANRADGIRVDGQSNMITRNRTGGNGTGGRGYDLHDGNRRPPCDNNVWRANTFSRGRPDCVKGPPGGSAGLNSPARAVR